MKQSTFLIVYQDSPRGHTYHFGPFVDRDHAQRFSDDLPTPQQGGVKGFRVTQPFTHLEADMASAVILAEREKLQTTA